MKKGFTLVEMVINCCVISIFFLGTATIMGSASKVYLREVQSSGARGSIETAVDDLKNYIMSGKDIKLFFYMDGSTSEINGINVEYDTGHSLIRAPLPEGTILYTDGTYYKQGENNGADLRGDLNLPDQDKNFLSQIAEGVDLGYKKIYLQEEGTFIQGLPYTKDFYRGMHMTLKISESTNMVEVFQPIGTVSPLREKKQKVYTIQLTGVGKNDVFTVTSNTAVAGMNEIEFN